MNRQNDDNWDDFGCVSENQAVAEQVARALEQDTNGQPENPPPEYQPADQPNTLEEKMPVASTRD